MHRHLGLMIVWNNNRSRDSLDYSSNGGGWLVVVGGCLIGVVKDTEYQD